MSSRIRKYFEYHHIYKSDGEVLKKTKTCPPEPPSSVMTIRSADRGWRATLDMFSLRTVARKRGNGDSSVQGQHHEHFHHHKSSRLLNSSNHALTLQ